MMSCQATVYLAYAPQFAALALYVLWRNTGILRARRSTWSSVFAGAGMICLGLAYSELLFCPGPILSIKLGALVSIGASLTYCGQFDFIVTVFLMYYKLDVGRSIQSKLFLPCDSQRWPSTFSSGASEVESDNAGEDHQQQQHDHAAVHEVHQPNHVLAKWLQKPIVLWGVPLITIGGCTLGFAVGYFGFADDVMFTCSGMDCFGPALSITLGAIPPSGSAVVGMAFFAFRGIKLSSKLFGDDSLGVKANIRGMTRMMMIIQASATITMILAAAKVLTVSAVFHVINVGISLMFYSFIVTPLVAQVKLRRLGEHTQIRSSSEALRKFLQDRENRRAFKEHLQSEFCAENILFYEHAMNHKAACKKKQNEERLAESYEKIVLTYLVSGAPLEVNLESSTTSQHRPAKSVRNTTAIAPAVQPTDPNCFDQAIEEVLALMSADPLMRFEQHPKHGQRWASFLERQAQMLRKLDDLNKVEQAVTSPRPIDTSRS